MIGRGLIIATVCVGLWGMPTVVVADNHTPEADADSILLPYPDRITALNAPINARLRYGATTKRDFVTDIIWGPDKAPGLYRLQARGTVTMSSDSDGPIMTMAREETRFTFGPKAVSRKDAGSVIANLTPTGGYRRIELRLPGLDTKAHRDQFGAIGPSLIDTGRIPPFKRLALRTGPDDTGGPQQSRREQTARIDILEAMQPMLGLVLDVPTEGVSTGARLTVLRRDLGDLFRDAGPIPLRVEGDVIGLADIAERRFIVVKLNRAELAPPMRANVDGYALIDLETGLPEAVVASIELVIIQGTDVTVFNFVERRALLPDVPTR